MDACSIVEGSDFDHFDEVQLRKPHETNKNKVKGKSA